MRKERRWFAHAQNLNDRRDGTTGSMLRHGRAWFHWGDRACLGVSWSWFMYSWLGLSFESGGENDFQLAFGLGIATLYVTLSGLLPYGALNRDWPRQTSLRLAFPECRLSFNVGHQGNEWPAKVGWEWYAYPIDALLGRQKYSAVELSSVATVVPMPEGSYPCTVKMERATWKRPRWPIATRVLRATVDIPGGIPKPGKGTESYNCGPDALYGLTTPARDVHEAVAAAAESVMRDRARYPL